MGATLERYRLFYYIKYWNDTLHFSVFLYQYITLLASLIYFWRGSEDPKDLPGPTPALCHCYCYIRWIITMFLVTTSTVQDGCIITVTYISSSSYILSMCWVREVWVVMVMLVAGCHGDISLGTSPHDRGIIIVILYVSIDQYWIIVWSSVSHVICMWSIGIMWAIIVHLVLLEKLFAYRLLYFLILLLWKLQLVSEYDHMISSCDPISLGFLGVGVWVYRGVMMMSLSLWLLLSIKSLASLRLTRKLQ